MADYKLSNGWRYLLNVWLPIVKRCKKQCSGFTSSNSFREHSFREHSFREQKIKLVSWALVSWAKKKTRFVSTRFVSSWKNSFREQFHEFREQNCSRVCSRVWWFQCFFFPRENFCTSKMAVKIFRFWKFSRAIWSFFMVFYYKNPKLPVKIFEKGGRESQKYPWKWSKSISFTGGENFHGEKKTLFINT